MKRKQFSEEQIIGTLKEAEAGAVVTDLYGRGTGCRARPIPRGRPSSAAWRYAKRLVADTMLDNAGLKDLLSKKMVTPAAKREAVAHLQTALEMSERRACAVVGADRTSMRYRSCREDDGDLRSRLRELAQQRQRFGYRRLLLLLRRDGITIHRKKTQRLYREEGLRCVVARDASVPSARGHRHPCCGAA